MWFDTFYKFHDLHTADQHQLCRSLVDSGISTTDEAQGVLADAGAIPPTPNKRMSYGAAVDRGAAGLVRGKSVIEGDLFITTRHLLFRETIIGQQPKRLDEITAEVIAGAPAATAHPPRNVSELPLSQITSWEAKRLPLRVGMRRLSISAGDHGVLEVVIGSKFSDNLAALFTGMLRKV